MENIDLILFIVAFVFFLIAFAPVDTKGWRFEWAAFATLVLTQVL